MGTDGTAREREPRDAEISRLKREVEMLREREASARAEAQDARKHFADLTAMSKRFASSMRVGVGERHQQRRRLAAQYAISRMLAGARDLDEAAPKIYQILGERLGWHTGILWRVEEDAGTPVLRARGVWRSSSSPREPFAEVVENTVFRRGEGLPGRVWERGAPVWVEDFPADGESTRAAAAAENGLRGALAFPIVDGSFVGVFELFRREVLPPDEDLMRTAELVGDQVAQFLERRRAEGERDLALARERGARERATGILESISDAFFALDEEQRFTYVNRRAEEMWGRRREGLIGERVWEVFPQAVGSEFHRAVDRVLREGEATEYEAVSTIVGAWVSGRVYPSPGGVSVLFHTIEERKRAEKAARLSRERATFRAALADALRTLEDSVEIQAEAVRVLGRYLGASRVFYAEIEPDGDHFRVAAEFADGVPGVAEGRHRLRYFGSEMVAKMRAGHTLVVEDAQVVPGLSGAERAAFASISVRAHVHAALSKGGVPKTFMSVHQSEPRAWTADEVALIEETAQRTWDAVRRARAQEAVRESEKRYRNLFESIGEGFCTIEMIDGDGKVVDYRFRETNPAFAEQTGLKDAGGRTAREVAPNLDETWFETFERVARTGESARFESYLGDLGRWFDFYAYRVGGPESRTVAVLFRNVTERKLAEDALRESENRYRSLVTATSSIVWVASPASGFLGEMPSWEEYTGQAHDEYRGFGWLEAVHPDDRARASAWTRPSREEGSVEIEFRLRRRDGEYRRVVSRGVPIPEGDVDEPLEWVGVVIDVEDNQRAEEEREGLRRETEEERARLQTILRQMPGGVFVAEASGRFVLTNDAGESIYGKTVESVEDCARSLLSYPDGEEIPLEHTEISRALRGEAVSGMEVYVVRPDGTRRVITSNSAPVRDGAGNVVAAVKAFEDVTARKEAEAAVEEAERHLAFYAGAREERQVISRELHDRVAHSIAVVRQNLELYEVLKDRDPGAAASKMELAKQEATASLRSTRDLSMMLRRSEVEGGLTRALAGLEETTVPMGVSYASSVAGDESLVPSHIGNQVFLILREAVRNAAAHSGCTGIAVRLEVTEEGVIGTVEDDGRGFEIERVSAGGGLRSMGERASLVGGTFRLRPASGGGTRIEITVPLRGEDA